MVQNYGASSTYNWTSNNTILGTYPLEVNVRAVGETRSYSDLRDINYVIAPCTTPTLTPNPTSPQLTGTSVLLTASTTCGTPPPLYQFWVRTPDSVWHMVQTSTSSTYT